MMHGGIWQQRMQHTCGNRKQSTFILQQECMHMWLKNGRSLAAKKPFL
jgi:hypothetical protein